MNARSSNRETVTLVAAKHLTYRKAVNKTERAGSQDMLKSNCENASGISTVVLGSIKTGELERFSDDLSSRSHKSV